MSPLGSGSVLKPPGTSTGVPSKVVHGFQPSFSKPNIVPRPAQADHVHAQGVLQVGGDLAQHLVGLDHLDRRARRVEPQRLAELVDAADVHARDGAGAQVQRHVVGLFVVQGGFDALARIHDTAPYCRLDVQSRPSRRSGFARTYGCNRNTIHTAIEATNIRPHQNHKFPSPEPASRSCGGKVASPGSRPHRDRTARRNSGE